MRKIISLCIVCISLALFFSGCKFKSVKDPEGKTKVGVILPLTGDIAFMGEMLKNAMIMNQDTSKVTLYFEDSKGDTKTAVSVVNNLISVKKCNVTVSFLPPVSEAINPICKKNDLLHFVFAFSPQITQNSNVIKQFPSSDYEAEQFISYIKTQQANKVVYFRHMYPDADLAFKEIVYPKLSTEGVNVVDIPHEQTCKDYRNLALKTKKEKPDLVVIQSLSMNYRNILTALRDNQIHDIVLDLNCVDFYDDNTLSESLISDVPFVGMEFMLDSAFVNFMDKYQRTYNLKPYVFGAFAHDLMFVINNLDITGFKKNDIINFYDKNVIKGATGVIHYDKMGNQALQYSILKYTNEGLRKVIK